MDRKADDVPPVLEVMEDPQANTDPVKTAHEHVVRQYAAQLEEASAPEAASVMAALPRQDAGEVAEYLDPRTAGKILAAMDPGQAARVIEQMHAPEASVVLTAMHPDDRVDVLEKVPDPLRGSCWRKCQPSPPMRFDGWSSIHPTRSGGS